MEHLEATEQGYRLLIPHSKGDQEGEGQYVELVRASKAPVEESVGLSYGANGVRTGQAEGAHLLSPRAGAPSYCPVAALDLWIENAEIHSGPVFRAFNRYGTLSGHAIEPQTINRIVKETAARLCLDPRLYSAHSTRSGCATYLLEHGIPLNVVAMHLRHKSTNTTLGYDRSSTARALMGAY